MAVIAATISPNSNHGVVFSARKQLPVTRSVASSSFFHRRFLRKSLLSVKNQMNPSKSDRLGVLEKNSASHSFDVVVVGAGIIGLTIARQFLTESDLSVAVVDASVPCAGATGAGQGYIWMIHKTPGTDTWELAMRSHKLWEMLAKNIEHQGMNPLKILGWKKTGSLLVGRTPEELSMIRRKVEQLSKVGLRAKFLSGTDLMLEEPALALGKEGGAVFLLDDFQLDARRTVAYIEKVNRQFMSDGRYAELFNEPVTSLLRSDSDGEVKGVQTSRNTLYSQKAVVIAAGSWSGSLIHDLLRDLDIKLTIPVKPRKGHLLVIQNFNPFKLNHGLMEVGYVNHQAATLQSTGIDSEPEYDAQASSISMTATMDASGNLVLGSSRQLVGFSTEIDESVINSIWLQAGKFFPLLREMSLGDLRRTREVRVGLRPYMPDGKPVIGPIPGMSNVILATGHEGGGLSLALGTAEMVVDMVLGNPGKVDHGTYAVQERFD